MNQQATHGMSQPYGLQSTQSQHVATGIHNSQTMQGGNALQNLPSAQSMSQNNYQVQVIALPVGAPPPQGAILAASPTMGPLSTAVPDQYQTGQASVTDHYQPGQSP